MCNGWNKAFFPSSLSFPHCECLGTRLNFLLKWKRKEACTNMPVSHCKTEHGNIQEMTVEERSIKTTDAFKKVKWKVTQLRLIMKRREELSLACYMPLSHKLIGGMHGNREEPLYRGGTEQITLSLVPDPLLQHCPLVRRYLLTAITVTSGGMRVERSESRREGLAN